MKRSRFTEEQIAFALKQQDRHTELHAELRLQLVGRPVVYERVDVLSVDPDRNAFHLVSFYVVLANKIEHQSHARMRKGAARMRLDRDAGK